MIATPTLPEVTSLEQARGVVQSLFDPLQQALWHVAQLRKELYGPASERHADAQFSKEQILLTLFPPPAEPPATQDLLLPPGESPAPARPRRQPAVKVLETVTQRIEPEEKVCPRRNVSSVVSGPNASNTSRPGSSATKPSGPSWPAPAAPAP